ncbi:MAG TPA: LPS export ABC transporter periplasmic protein LptC [Candidatus Limnocylindria bacterium]|nr:LPS export ABC transporter periplasmic protein LptC [Candidatus Limnocylindria bacterium]
MVALISDWGKITNQTRSLSNDEANIVPNPLQEFLRVVICIYFGELIMRKTRRAILLAVILLSLGGVAFKVAEVVQKMNIGEVKDPVAVLNALPDTVLQIKDFHRAKIENGRKVWELFGDEANYLKDKREAVIKRPRFLYYDKKDETAETSAEAAHIFLNEKDLERLELKGAVRVAMKGYVLTSELANYVPAKEQILLPSRTQVVGEGISIEGASMEVELEDKKIRMVRDVKTKIEPDKLAKKKSKTASPKIGG